MEAVCGGDFADPAVAERSNRADARVMQKVSIGREGYGRCAGRAGRLGLGSRFRGNDAGTGVGSRLRGNDGRGGGNDEGAWGWGRRCAQRIVREALVGEPVGLVRHDDRLWTVRFGHLEIGRLDGYALRIIKTPVKALPMYPG